MTILLIGLSFSLIDLNVVDTVFSNMHKSGAVTGDIICSSQIFGGVGGERRPSGPPEFTSPAAWSEKERLMESSALFSRRETAIDHLEAVS